MLFNVTNWPGGNIFNKLVSRFVIKYYNRNIIKQLRQHILFNYRWSAESVFAKNLLSIVHLLLAIVTFYQTRKNIYLDLPKSLNIDVLIVRSLNGSTTYKKETETLFRYGMISMIFIFLVVLICYQSHDALLTPSNSYIFEVSHLNEETWTFN